MSGNKESEDGSDNQQNSINNSISEEPITSSNAQGSDIQNNLTSNLVLNFDIEAIEKQVTKSEGKKQKTHIKLPPEPKVAGTGSEKEVVGDDFNKKEEQHILCECQPNDTGAAVPAVCSFNKSSAHLSGSFNSTNSHQEIDTAIEVNQNDYFISKEDNLTTESKSPGKKPSLIPKLSRPSCSNQRSNDAGRFEFNANGKINQFNDRVTLNKNIAKSPSNRFKSANSSQNSRQKLEHREISTGKLNVQEKMTIKSARQKSGGNTTELASQIANKQCSTSTTVQVTKNTNGLDELYRSISQMKEVILSLSNAAIFKNHKDYNEKLLWNLNEIKKIADQLNYDKNSRVEDFVKEDVNTEPPKKKSKSNKSKENKIYIKFMPSKDKEDKRKHNGEIKESSDLPVPSEVTEEPTDSVLTTKEKANNENTVKDTDSMDGVFIPSCEPPPNLEEEEEPNGLDITITFPEFNQFLSNQAESHLSVRLSDISAEALRKLKRCPKDFTLRMDFIQGKILFQSGKAPVNNFSIGPDLKFIENPIDDRKSDIINIKPSTECKFTSQLISVESIRDRSSYKSLKSTDSELFNVVNLPFIYRNPSLNSSTKSCITFRNENIMSMAYIARQFFKSMPQIPSLTNIFEGRVMETFPRTALWSPEKKRKNRPSQKEGLCIKYYVININM